MIWIVVNKMKNGKKQAGSSEECDEIVAKASSESFVRAEGKRAGPINKNFAVY